MKHLFYVIILVSLFGMNIMSCANYSHRQNTNRETITVSIAPLKHIVEAITGDDFDITILVPAGSSPETYSPTPKQLTTVNNSVLLVYLETLEFEHQLIKRLSSSSVQLVNLCSASGIVPLVEHDDVDVTHVDPHIWLSVRNLQHITESLSKALEKHFPDSIKYVENALKFNKLLEEKDTEYRNKLFAAESPVFLIYHPALSYLARDYGLTQLSIEEEGKDPTPTSVAAVIDQARNEHVGYIMYQSEFSQNAVRSLVEETGIKSIEINPLSENIVDELDRIVNIISTNGNE